MAKIITIAAVSLPVNVILDEDNATVSFQTVDGAFNVAFTATGTTPPATGGVNPGGTPPASPAVPNVVAASLGQQGG